MAIPYRGVAQLVEHRSPKPGVAGSSPVSPANKNDTDANLCHFCCFGMLGWLLRQGFCEAKDRIGRVQTVMPQQPWPKGTSKRVAKELGMPHSQMQRAVAVLIDRGIFRKQVDGVLSSGRSQAGVDTVSKSQLKEDS